MSNPVFQNQFAMRCPKCKGTGRIDVQALVYLRLVRDGTDADLSQNGDHEWGVESAASCACGFHGKVYDFQHVPVSKLPQNLEHRRDGQGHREKRRTRRGKCR